MEFTEGLVDVAATLFEVGTAGFDLTDEVAKLAGFARFGVVHADDRLDLVEREAEAFTAQNQAQSHVVSGVEDALCATSFWVEEPVLLVIPDRAQRDVVLVSEFGDRPS